MKLSNIASFYVARMRARVVQELFAVVGVAIGVGLLFASQVANTSLGGSVDQFTRATAGRATLQLRARDPQGFSESIVGKVRRLPGVRRAAPVLEVNAYLVGATGRQVIDLVGLDPSSRKLGGALAGHFTSAQLEARGALALTASVARRIGAGRRRGVELDVGGSNTAVAVGAVMREADIGGLAGGPFAIVPLSFEQRLVGHGDGITRVLVEPQPGQESPVRAELERLAAGRLNVLPAISDAAIFRQAEGPASESTGLFSAVSALVGFLFAFNAMLLTVPQRRRLVADLRLDGYSPTEIAMVLLCDALMLGVGGVITGLLLGDWISHHLLEARPGYLSLAFPVGSQRIVTWQCVVIAAGGGLLAAYVGVLGPLRGIFAGSTSPVREQGAPSGLGILCAAAGGMACLGVSAVILLVGVHTVQLAVLAFASLLVAMLLLLPVLLGAIIGLADRVQREVVDASRRLALIELRSSAVRVRSAAIVATGAVAVFGSVAIEGARHNLAAGLNRAAAEMARVTDLWITAAGTGSTLATAPLQGNFARRLSRLQGVRAVRVYRGSFLDIGDRRTLVIAPPRTAVRPIPPHQVVEGNLAHASALLRGRGWATVSQALVGELHLYVGKRFTLPTSRPAVFRLAAVTTNFGWSPGVVVVNADDYARAWGSSDPSAYQLELNPGVPLTAAQAEVRRALGPGSGLTVQTAAQRERIDRATQEQGLDRLRQIAMLVLLAAVLAMAAAMGAMIWQRRLRLASLKVDGYDERELWRALLYESALLLGAGCSIGALFGLYGQLLLSHALATVTGFPVVFSIAGLGALMDVVLVTGVAFAIVAIPGYLAARVQPRLQCG